MSASSALRRRGVELGVRIAQGGRLIRFGLVGLVTTTLDVVLFHLGTEAGLPTVVANTGSYSTSVVLSFLLHRFWTFNDAAGPVGLGRPAIRFLIVQCGAALLSNLVVAHLAMVFSKDVAKLISVPILFSWNFIMAKVWVFRGSRSIGAG